MCKKCGGGNINVFFPGNTKQCNCNCSSGGGNPPPDGNKYMIFPFGGTDGDVLVKQGDKVIFKKIAEIIGLNQESAIIAITSDGQTIFGDIIPEGKLLLQVFIEGIKQIKDVDYTVPTGTRNINWLNTNLPLQTDYIFEIIYI